MGSLRKYTVAVLVVCGVLAMNFSSVFAAEKPNILVVWGDDIGQSNISHYTHGMMGYKTPNIDRIAEEGMTFTDYYGEQSCTAGRSAFIMGQSVFRTGLSKVGLPGAKEGMQEILKGVEKGWVRPHVDRTFLIEQVGEAHAYIEARKNIGKIVLVTGG